MNRLCLQHNKNDFSKQGFSLVEVLLAVVIMGIVVAPILSAFFSSMKTNLKAKDLMAATDFSQSIVEEIEKSSLEELQLKFEKNSTDLEETPYRLESLNLKKNKYIAKKIDECKTLDDFMIRCKKIDEDNQGVYYTYILEETGKVHFLYFFNNVDYSMYKDGKYRYHYDVLIDITPVDAATIEDDFYALSVSVDTYVAGTEDNRFESHECTMNGSIMNRY